MFYKRKNEEENTACETQQTENISAIENKIISIEKFTEIISDIKYTDETLKSKITSCVEDFKKEKNEEKFTEYNIISALKEYMIDKISICTKCKFYKNLKLISSNINGGIIIDDNVITIKVDNNDYCVDGIISKYAIKLNNNDIIVKCDSFKLKEGESDK